VRIEEHISLYFDSSPKIYWWRCISSNDAHFVWLIEIPMFPILTKNATSPEEQKRKKKERAASN